LIAMLTSGSEFRPRSLGAPGAAAAAYTLPPTRAPPPTAAATAMKIAEV
jgi:hypothetical protein